MTRNFHPRASNSPFESHSWDAHTSGSTASLGGEVG